MAKNISHPESDSAIYNIKAVVTQTGLNPATIRAWERRYGLPHPQRTEGGHRQYSQRDVEIIQWLIAHQEEGMSISHAVELWQSLVNSGEDPLESEEGTDASIARVAVPVLGEQMDELRKMWIQACLSFDRESAELVLTHAFSLFPPEAVCIELLQKGLVEIGDGWHQGSVTVQQEHFTTTLSEQRLEILIAAVPAPTRPERILVSAAPGERHTFGPYLLTYLLRRQGWAVTHLGADVPVENFGPTIEKLQPQLIIVSAQLFHTAAAIKDVAEVVQEKDVMLAFGGGAFNLMPEIRNYIPGYFLGETFEEAINIAAELLSTHPEAPESLGQDQSHQEALAQYIQRRSLIESHVWEIFTSTNESTQYLASINEDINNAITAALKLGSLDLLGTDGERIENLLATYRQSKAFVQEYIQVYTEGANIHLGEPAKIIVDWLRQVVARQ